MEMLHIVNLIVDDKFIDNVIEFHSLTSAYCRHEYILLSCNRNQKYRYITRGNDVVRMHPDCFIDYVNKGNVDAIFLHSLFSIPLELLPKIRKEIKTFWFAWGYDIYESPSYSPFIPLQLYHEQTSRFIKQYGGGILSIVKSFVKMLLGKYRSSEKQYHLYKEAVERIDYFSGVLPAEYGLAKTISYFHALPVSYSYVIKNFGIIHNENCEGNNILIGNSANPTNNHLDVFAYLKSLELADRNIILPLSYGGSQNYVSHVIKEAKNILGNNVTILEDFLPLNKYTQLIESCNVAIFYHERQQALGNIFLAIKRGCKVFLSEKSITYQYFKNVGVVIFSIQHDLNQMELDKPLSERERKRNKDIVLSLNDENVKIANMLELYKIISDAKKL